MRKLMLLVGAAHGGARQPAFNIGRDIPLFGAEVELA